MSALRNVSALIFLQLGSRVLTFVLNALVARQVGPLLFGVAMVNFYLIYTTILFLAREGLRRTSLRVASISSKTELEEVSSLVLQRTAQIEVINSVWLIGMPIALALAVIICCASVWWSGGVDGALSITQLPYYHEALYANVASALIEMSAEPLYTMASRLGWVTLRVRIELVAVLLRTLVTAVMVIYFQCGLEAFAVAQMSYSLCLAVGYYIVFIISVRTRDDLKPRKEENSLMLSSVRDFFPQAIVEIDDSRGLVKGIGRRYLPQREHMSLIRGFTVQSVEKLLLTEGEKLVLAGFSTHPEENGVYSLVQNLGSLVARTLFQPLEECSFVEFSRLHSTTQCVEEDKLVAVDTAQTTMRHKTALHSAHVLVSLLKAVVLIGLLFVCFGPPYSFLLLDLIYGARWIVTSAPQALSWYCLYVLIMAVNGITEAFVFAVIGSVELARYNAWLLLFSLLYVTASIVLLPWGSVGLIAANCVNMTARIVYSCSFIASHFRFLQAHSEQSDNERDVMPHSILTLFRLILPTRSLMITMASAAALAHVSFQKLSIGQHAWSLLSATVSNQSGDMLGPALLQRQMVLQRYAAHVALGVLLVIAVLIVAWWTERRFFSSFRELLGGRGELDVGKRL